MSDDVQPSESGAQVPPKSERMPLRDVGTPHPALLADASLLEQCDFRFQRRSGPGGQHRNKTSSGVFLLHQPTGIVGEATERRSQADNRSMALQRLRFRLAVDVRTPSLLDGPTDDIDVGVRDRYRGVSLRMNDANPDKPAVLALVINDLVASGGQPSLVAPQWATTTSNVVNLLKSHPAAFVLANAIRAHHGRRALK